MVTPISDAGTGASASRGGRQEALPGWRVRRGERRSVSRRGVSRRSRGGRGASRAGYWYSLAVEEAPKNGHHFGDSSTILQLLSIVKAGVLVVKS